ncbi:MAG: hypothetical protein U0900_06485 [Myxococcota bacterium]
MQTQTACPARPSAMPAPSRWTAARFFDLLPQLGRLRVISICGPSVFESLCCAGAYSIDDGSLDMVTSEFHWHVALERFRHLQSHDAVHGRSGRNVLFFELRERREAAPFLRVYVYRAPGADFDPAIESVFRAAHAELADGVELAAEAK